MRVLMLSWEYPPVLVGGLGRHVHALATSLAAAGHDVTVVTRYGDGAALDERVEGVRVVRAPEDPPLFPLTNHTLLAWTMAFNHALTRAALAVTVDTPVDVVHAHDWLVTHAAVTLKHHLGAPLVATVHATEAGRHQGWLPNDTNRCIHSVEWWLTYEARRVLVCSDHMRWEVSRLFDLPGGKVEVIPNGVDIQAWQAPSSAIARVRQQYAGSGPLLVYAGRLVYEKGVQDLIAALPRLRRRHPGLRLVVAGEGPHGDALRDEVKRRRLQRCVTFTGFLSQDQLPPLLGAADCVVVPSLYEPFGMIALEAGAAGTPVVAAASGGLAKLIEPGVTGMTFPAGDQDRLVEAVSSVLSDEILARRLARRAREVAAARYGWPSIAERTVAAYQRALRDEQVLQERLAAGAAPTVMPRIVVPEGNLLAQDAT